MQTVRINTTQNIEIDYEVADLGERILAYLIDMSIFLLIMIFTFIIGFAVSIGVGSMMLIVMVVIYFSLFVFYDLVCEIFMNGQSVGKRVMKIKVVSLDGGQPSISQYLLRWLFRIVDFTISSNLGALICVAVTDKKQRIGDIVAGTTLIRTTPRTQIGQVAYMPEATDYKPVFVEAGQLSDEDVALIHEVVQTYFKSRNSVIVYNMASRVKEHLGVTKPESLNDLQFLQTILKDYNHITTAEAI
jgi:uncharacterized RDD family membrane protein YckC